MSRVDRYVTQEVRSRYPLATKDLAEDEVKTLTKILAIHNPAPHQVTRPGFPENINSEIKNAISEVEPVLRRSALIGMMPANVGREAKLCGTHEDLNQYVIANLYELLKTEVINRTDTMDRYAEHIQDFDRMILRCVQALRRLWGDSPPDETRQLPINYPHPQGNGCEACILARVVRDPGYLRNLRIAVLSRTYSQTGEKLPRLLCFLHYAVQCHHGVDTIMAETEELASDFMISRKKASALAHKERRSLEEVDMYQPGDVHPALREEMFGREQGHHRRHQRERSHGSHAEHRHGHRGTHRSRRDADTDDITPQLQSMSLEAGPGRSSRHGLGPPLPRQASSRHGPSSRENPSSRHASHSHRSRRAPAHSGSRRRRASGRHEDDEDFGHP